MSASTTTNGLIKQEDTDFPDNDITNANIDTLDGIITDRCLPAVTSEDNGKIIRVVNGEWALSEITSASGVSF